MPLPSSVSILWIRPAGERTPRRGARTAGLWVGLALASGCSLFGAGKASPDLDAAARKARIEALRTAIEQDHRRLEDLITRPRDSTSAELHADPELEAIASRLAAHEREREQLEATSQAEPR